MNFKYDNVYINSTGTIVGPIEHDGPLSKYYDEYYDDFYFGRDSWEKSESKLIEDSVDIALRKNGITRDKVDIHISGDLLNQIVATNYASKNIGIPLIGIYGACSTSVLGLIIGSNMVESNQIKRCISSTSSHNLAAEKQFRYPVEYGGPKKKTLTFTCTGGCSAILSSEKKGIKVESSTLGRVIDMGVTDVYNMGAVMAASAGDTLNRHLKYHNRKPDYYDLILTGDLGVYGKAIFRDYVFKEYGYTLNNYEDAGSIIYDRAKQPVYAGASGPAALPLVAYGYIFSRMLSGELKRVLLIGTGALMNSSMVNQKCSIPSISHAISLEVIK